MSEFIGVIVHRTYLIEAIRRAFDESRGHFDICALHKLPGYENDTFSRWVHALHCQKNVPAETMRLAQLYVVNYFLCPDSTDEFEVEAYAREVWPERVPTRKPILKIGKLSLYWGEA